VTDKEEEGTKYTVVEYKTTTGTHGVLFAKDKKLASSMVLAKSVARSQIVVIAITNTPVNGKLTYILNK